MAFPKKFRHLLDLTRDDVEQPDEVWVTYSVCACDDDACCWQGWILEDVRKAGEVLRSKTDQICPNCGRDLFRTWASWRLEPSANQERRLQPGRDYELVEMFNEDDVEEPGDTP